MNEVPRRSLVDEAHDRLRELIVSGRLAPGAPIIETEVASLLGVSRTHLRAALQRLQQTGFVVTAPISVYSRSRVAPLRASDARALFQIVGAIEGVAARGAAELAKAARRALVEGLRRTNAALLASAKAQPRDVAGAYRLDTEFHHRLVERGGGPRVLAVYEMVKPLADRYERIYTSALIESTAESVLEHAAVIEAIEAGDTEAAQRGIEANWRNAAARFAETAAALGGFDVNHPHREK